MNWLNLEIRTLRTPEYIGSDPTERATWISLLAYCCEQENGGRIVGAKKWKDRQWQQLCAVTQREVSRTHKLLAWEGDDLLVTGYPTSKEAEVRSKREAGREGGRRSGEARSLKTHQNTPSTASSSACPDASPGASTEGKEKGKEGERNPTGGEPAAPKVAKEPSGPHADFIHRWTTEYPKYHDGEAYLFQGAKDGAQVSRLLKAMSKTPEEWQRCFVAAWKRPDLFNCKSAASISGFVSRLNDIISELNAAKRGPGTEGDKPESFRVPMNPPPQRPAHLDDPKT